MKKIIVPVDFTPASINAVTYAASLANIIRAEVHIVHVIPITSSMIAYSIPNFLVDEIDQKIKRKLEKLKEKLLDDLKDNIIVHVQILGGNIVEEINAYADKVKPWLVLMGPETAGYTRQLILGGTATGVMENVNWPILFIPASTNFKSIRKIGLACDLKSVKETLPLESIESLMDELDAELFIVHIQKDDSSETKADMKEEAEHLRLLSGRWHPRFDIITNKNIEIALEHYCFQHKLDVLIVIPKHQHSFRNLFHRKHAGDLIGNPFIPILTLHN